MSKILEATCENSIVRCEGVVITGVTVLSKGKASSSGILVIEEDKKTYIASTVADLETTLTQVSTALANISSALSAIDSAGFWSGGGAPTPPFLGGLISGVNNAKSALDTLKGNLK